MTSRTGLFEIMAVLVVVLLAESQAVAQMGPGMRMGRCRGYSGASTPVTVHGLVQSVNDSGYRCRWSVTEVTLKTDQGNYDVRLGPRPFLTQSNFTVAKGDELSVTGFRVGPAGTTFLIAQQVSKAGKTLTLRNAQGFPAWAGRGMGCGSCRGRCGGGGGRGYGGAGRGCCGR